MLNQLSIKNVAVIDKLELDLGGGMTALTGETGAGKSIIIDSINMILGERTNKDIVRYGTDKATVQAVFSDIPGGVRDALSEYEIDDEDVLIITRTVSAEGKSTARVNGMLVPLGVLREIAGGLINIHGQHDNQALLTPKKHIEFLDFYANDSRLKEEYGSIYNELKGIKRKISELETNEAEKAHRLDLLDFQIKEIDAAKLVDGEEEDLKERRDILSNAEKLNTALQEAYENLYDNPNAQSSYDMLSVAAAALSEVADINPRIKEAYDTLTAALYSCEDAAHSIKEFGDEIEFDEEELNGIEERLNTISKLKLKYGSDIGEILKYLNCAREELSEIEHGDERLLELSEKEAKLTKKLTAAGGKLSKIRRESAVALGAEITKALSELNMEKAVLEISVQSGDEFYPDGMDIVEFMISTNPGEPLKPLAKIASGGELSRVILAIKSILADSDGVGTMIFDEIDTGVSGAAAAKITMKLLKIAEGDKQVICITHLPQLAAAADNHFLIVKDSSADMASTTLKKLDCTERERELARIIDGINITDIALSHAHEMLKKYHKTT